MSVKVMGKAWDLDIPPAHKLVMLALADHADHDGENAYPGQELLAKKTGLSVRHVRRILDILENQQLISLESGGKGRSQRAVYSVLKTGQGVPLSDNRKADKVSGNQSAKSGQCVRLRKPKKPDKVSSLSNTLSGHPVPNNRTSETLKADICDKPPTPPIKEEPSLTVHEPLSPNGDGGLKSDHQQIVDRYFELFNLKTGSKPHFTSKDGATIKSLLIEYGLPKMLRILDRLFESRDKFIIEAGYTVAVLSTRMNGLIVEDAKAEDPSLGRTPAKFVHAP